MMQYDRLYKTSYITLLSRSCIM